MNKCLYCGKEIIAKSHKKGVPRKYCNLTCYRLSRNCKEYADTICQYCGKTFRETRDRPNLYCSKACSSKAQKRDHWYGSPQEQQKHRNELLIEYKALIEKAEEIRRKLEDERQCKICGKWFIDAGHSKAYCSEECRKKHDNITKDRRIYKNGEPDLSINLTRLYMRDLGKCKICGREINFDCDSNSDYYPSIDHIIPIARGGLHRWDNVQLACRICNSLKADKI